MKGLAFFVRTTNRRHWNLASFHSPHSLTWSWILSFRLPTGNEGRWFGLHRWNTNQGRQWIFQFGRCCLQWHRQQPMWYRDLYTRKRDEVDELKVRAAMPRPPLRSPFKPTVIDGGESIH